MRYRFFVPVFALVFANTVFLHGQDTVVHSVFLIGDAGEHYLIGSPAGGVLRKQIERGPAMATVLYLGDNVYPGGVGPHGSSRRAQNEKILMEQVSWITGLPARGIFLPGNHDWDHWGKNGWQYISNAEVLLDSLDDPVELLPGGGCPGPAEVELSDLYHLVIIDTQWFLHRWNKPGSDSNCPAKTEQEVLDALAEILRRNAHKRVIVAAHHPLITYGNHGGYFSFKEHIFPLTDIHPKLLIPVPVLGSLYPLYRTIFGHRQDVHHRDYQRFAWPIQNLLAQYPGTIYAAGHEHALQYILSGQTHYIVSGSGVKADHVRKKGKALFASSSVGFVRADLFSEGKILLRYFRADKKFPEGKEIYAATLQPQ